MTTKSSSRNHIAFYERSIRLQKIIWFLEECRAANAMPTTRDIQRSTGVCGVPQAMGQLRDAFNGFQIDCMYSHKTRDGNMVYKYRLRGRVPDKVWQFARDEAGVKWRRAA